MFIRTVLFSLLAAILLSATEAYGFGAEGHSIVAEIAQRRLTPQAAAMVSRLLGPGTSLASVASWADDTRSERKETSNWHFVDIPLGETTYVESRDCKSTANGDCVVKRVSSLQSQLRCAASDEARREALLFAVHLVGDIHQPLHTVGGYRGGNEFMLRGAIRGQTCRGDCQLPPDTNLHALWDVVLIERTTWSWGAYVERLEASLLRHQSLHERVEPDSALNWALQSHGVARLVWNDRLIPADCTIDERYYAATLPLLDQQLALGGMRLAALLNSAYASDECGPAARASTSAEVPPAVTARATIAGDQEAVATAALAYLLQRAPQVRNPAIVLDIDDTAIHPVDPASAGTAPWSADRKMRAVAPVLAFYNAARQKGVSIFFVAARPEAQRAATVKQLSDAGYRDWAGLVLRPNELATASPSTFKAPERARLALEGYTVIANIGNEPGDLSGGYAERSFLLPSRSSTAP